MIGIKEQIEVANKIVASARSDGLKIGCNVTDLLADNMPDLSLNYIREVLIPQIGFVPDKGETE